MRLTDLMPIGSNKAGCICFQAKHLEKDGTVRTVWWTDEYPGYGEIRQVYIHWITEEAFNNPDLPEVFTRALAEVLEEILSNPETAKNVKRNQSAQMIERGLTAFDLKTATTEEHYIQALRAKSRLGKWL